MSGEYTGGGGSSFLVAKNDGGEARVHVCAAHRPPASQRLCHEKNKVQHKTKNSGAAQ